MVFSHDIAIAIYDNAWMAQNKKAATPQTGDIPVDAYSYGEIHFPLAMDEMLGAIIKQTKHTQLIPPRVIITAPFKNEVQRTAYKESAIKGGAREVLLLERPMAVSIGQEGDITKAGKRLYILWEPGQVEVALLDDHKVAASLRIDAERSFATGEKTIPPQPNALSDHALTQLEAFITKHVPSTGQVYLWSPQTPPGTATDMLARAAPTLQVVPTPALLEGAMHVLRDLSFFLKGAKR